MYEREAEYGSFTLKLFCSTILYIDHIWHDGTRSGMRRLLFALQHTVDGGAYSVVIS